MDIYLIVFIPLLIYLAAVWIWKDDLNKLRVRSQQNPDGLGKQRLFFQSVVFPSFGLFMIIRSQGQDMVLGLLLIGIGLVSLVYSMIRKRD